jgi:Ni,Fe-hydrogenase III small subunit
MLANLLRGPATGAFPNRPAEFPERFRGRPALDASRCSSRLARCAAGAPSALVQISPAGEPRLDLGACLFSPEEAAACPEGAIRFTGDPRLAATGRDALLATGDEAPAVQALDRAQRRLFGRSLRLRSVVAGSCGGCEAELVALGNVVFDLQRFGIQFVASPRHADGIVVTGAVNVNMELALRKAWEAVPDPRLVIAVGACAIAGGPFAGSPEVRGGVPDDLPVDLWVPGCPPHPITLLDGLLRLLGRIEDGSRARRSAPA